MKWISAKDRLPEPGVTVLVIDRLFVKSDNHNNDREYLGYREPGIRFGVVMESGWFRSEGVNGNCEITHWMPLPLPPSERNKS